MVILHVSIPNISWNHNSICYTNSVENFLVVLLWPHLKHMDAICCLWSRHKYAWNKLRIHNFTINIQYGENVMCTQMWLNFKLQGSPSNGLYPKIYSQDVRSWLNYFHVVWILFWIRIAKKKESHKQNKSTIYGLSFQLYDTVSKII